jgi:hypothetical protein
LPKRSVARPDPRGREAEIFTALAAHGLISRGWFVLMDGEAQGYRSALLVGQAGASIWPHVQGWLGDQPEEVDHPIDQWTRVTLDIVAAGFGARAAFPFERPYWPFQRWAQRAERLKPSPLGILMHPEYGLWHAYRGALLFEAEIAAPVVAEPIHLCDLCVGKPCLSACPTGAWSVAGFDRDACMEHLHGANGAACMSGGCLARNACPESARFRYPPEVQAHHQAFFRDGRAA